MDWPIHSLTEHCLSSGPSACQRHWCKVWWRAKRWTSFLMRMTFKNNLTIIVDRTQPNVTKGEVGERLKWCVSDMLTSGHRRWTKLHFWKHTRKWCQFPLSASVVSWSCGFTCLDKLTLPFWAHGGVGVCSSYPLIQSKFVPLIFCYTANLNHQHNRVNVNRIWLYTIRPWTSRFRPAISGTPVIVKGLELQGHLHTCFSVCEGVNLYANQFMFLCCRIYKTARG